MELYKIRFTASATIGMKGQLRRFLHTVRDEINFNGGSAIVSEYGNWFESEFIFQGKNLNENLANYAKNQFESLKRFSN